VTLFALRRALRSAKLACLYVEGSAVALDPGAVDVDVLRFRRLVAEGTPEALGAATEIYVGDLLEGISVGEAAFEEWLTGEREQFRVLAFRAFEGLLAHQLKAGAEEPGLTTALRLLALDPLQEPVHRTAMRLQAALDRPGAALRQYQACVAVLQRGSESRQPRTQRLYKQILRRELPVAARPRGRTDPRRRDEPATARLAEHRLPASPVFVGRQLEMERLRTAMDEAARSNGAVVAVLGEAGVGKTRLLAAAAAEAHQRGYRSILGRSNESEGILPLAPWVEAVRAGGVLSDARVFDELGGPLTAELARLFPEIGAPPPPVTAGHSRLFEGIARLLGQLAARQPLAVLLEDLHWADDLSARLLGFVARRAGSWPLLLIVTARDEELARASVLRRVLDELTRTERFTRLVLAPLDRSDAELLVRALVRTGRDAPDVVPLAERIWAVSRGNPFMIVETVNWLGDLAGGRRTPRSLPPRVREVVASRLDRLSSGPAGYWAGRDGPGLRVSSAAAGGRPRRHRRRRGGRGAGPPPALARRRRWPRT
jgi:DNA-binding SARP family transcriptional activator